MRLLLPNEVVTQLLRALAEAGSREVGGILMGEHVAANTFRVMEVTVQKRGGTYATFLRLVESFLAPLRAFFQATNHDYTRFNYLGEWHSHHSFALVPSGTDHKTMRDLVEDSSVGAKFAVLMLVRRDQLAHLRASVTIYQPGEPPLDGIAVVEEAGS